MYYKKSEVEAALKKFDERMADHYNASKVVFDFGTPAEIKTANLVTIYMNEARERLAFVVKAMDENKFNSISFE